MELDAAPDRHGQPQPSRRAQLHDCRAGHHQFAGHDGDGGEGRPGTVITLAFDILFAFDKADISDRAQAKIERLADKIPDDASVEVSGHTDSIGSASYNKDLSQQRAKAVAAILETAQPDLKLDVEGFGKDRPVAPNSQGGEDNPEGRALNRRVEIRYEG